MIRTRRPAVPASTCKTRSDNPLRAAAALLEAVQDGQAAWRREPSASALRLVDLTTAGVCRYQRCFAAFEMWPWRGTCGERVPGELRLTGIPHAAVGAVPNRPADHQLALQSSPPICAAENDIATRKTTCASNIMHSTKMRDKWLAFSAPPALL